MKVKLKAIKPNPFRDFTNYPNQENKLKSLEVSIKDMGFWDKLIVSENGDCIELVYGYHCQLDLNSNALLTLWDKLRQ